MGKTNNVSKFNFWNHLLREIDGIIERGSGLEAQLDVGYEFDIMGLFDVRTCAKDRHTQRIDEVKTLKISISK